MGKGNGCRYQTAVNLDTCVASSSPRHRNLSNAALEFGINFDSRTTPHMLPKQRGGCPNNVGVAHTLVLAAHATTRFFNYI